MKTKSRNIKGLIFWTALMGIILLGLIFGVMQRSNTKIRNVIVDVVALDQNKNIIDDNEILRLLNEKMNRYLIDYEISELNIMGIESFLRIDPRIEKVEVYIDNRAYLHIDVEQKKPIVRVSADDGSNYYLNNIGERIPMSKLGTIRVPIITGDIEPFDPDFLEKKESNLFQAFHLAMDIYTDEFIAALVEQIHIEKNKLTLIPKVGNQKITLGAYKDIEEKLYKLKHFYRNGLPYQDWNEFDSLRLQYKGQVVGVEKLNQMI